MTKATSNEKAHKKLLDLHRRITKLEKLEIRRQRAEKELKKIEKAYHDFFSKSKQFMGFVQDRSIIFLTPSLAHFLGYSRDELTHFPFASYIHPDELPRLVKYYADRIAGKDVPPVYTTLIKHRDGRYIPVELRAGIIPYHGKPANFAIIKILKNRGKE